MSEQDGQPAHIFQAFHGLVETAATRRLGGALLTYPIFNPDYLQTGAGGKGGLRTRHALFSTPNLSNRSTLLRLFVKQIDVAASFFSQVFVFSATCFWCFLSHQIVDMKRWGNVFYPVLMDRCP